MSGAAGDFHFSKQGDRLIVRIIHKRLIEQNIHVFDLLFAHLAVQLGDVREVVIDFSQVGFLSSSALGKLIRLHQVCTQQGKALSIRNLSPDILAIFKLTKLDKMLDCDDEPFDDEPFDDDKGEGGMGVPARLKPPLPGGSGSAAATPPKE